MELKTEVKEVSSVVKQIEVTIPAENITNELDKYYVDLKKAVKIKGFRPGKAPRAVLERLYKKQVENEVIGKLINETYETALKGKSINPVSPPIIDSPKFEPKKDLTYTARVEISPQIDLKESYFDLELEQEKLEITEDNVNKYLEDIRNYNAQLKAVEKERSVQSGDFVVIDFSGDIDGAPLKGGKVQDQLMEIKPDNFLPGFTNQLIGLKPGTDRELTISLPEDYKQKELAGKTLNFQVRIKEIKEKIIPTLDDNFARDAGEFETLADLKEHLRKEITRREEEQIKIGLYNNLLQKILENNPFEVPPSLVEKQTEYLISQARAQMSRQGLKVDSSTMINRELKESYRPVAEFQVKRSFLLADIAAREGITAEPSDIKTYIEKLGGPGGESFNLQQGGEEAKEQIKAKVLEEKSLAFLAEKAKITLVDRKNNS